MGDTRAIMNTIRRFAGDDERNTIEIEESRLQQAIVQQLARKTAENGTHKLSKESRDALPLLGLRPYGLSEDRASNLIVLPQNAGSQKDFSWLIEIQGLGARLATLAIEVKGDIILGIARPGQPAPDLDLSAYGAEDKGVSRRHAVIRPTRNRLYVIDLQSTNGTRVNTLPVNAGIAMELHGNDTVSLGALMFNIKVFATPEMLAQPLPSSDAHASSALTNLTSAGDYA